jgi:hypothetical protein
MSDGVRGVAINLHDLGRLWFGLARLAPSVELELLGAAMVRRTGDLSERSRLEPENKLGQDELAGRAPERQSSVSKRDCAPCTIRDTSCWMIGSAAACEISLPFLRVKRAANRPFPALAGPPHMRDTCHQLVVRWPATVCCTALAPNRFKGLGGTRQAGKSA